MSRAAWRFKATDVARAIRSVQSTGLPVKNVEIVDGVIRVNVDVENTGERHDQRAEAAVG